mgnify:CR=1 FL=1
MGWYINTVSLWSIVERLLFFIFNVDIVSMHAYIIHYQWLN